MALVESVVWGEPTLDFIALVKDGKAGIIPAGSSLLVLDDTATIVNGEHTYERTRCLWVDAGEVVYNVSNTDTSEHGKGYRRIDG